RPLAANEIQGIVAQNNVTAANWKLDGNTQDSSGRGFNGTAHGAVEWAPGQSSTPDSADLAANLAGTPDQYLSSAPVVDTSKSFSVTAWVKLNTKLPYWAAVASQNGTRTSVFNLGYSGSGQDHWVFAMHGSDADTPTTNVGAWSAETVQAGVWTHLAATYNAATGEVQLYVNGVLSGTTTMTTPWNATAPPVRSRPPAPTCAPMTASPSPPGSTSIARVTPRRSSRRSASTVGTPVSSAWAMSRTT